MTFITLAETVVVKEAACVAEPEPLNFDDELVPNPIFVKPFNLFAYADIAGLAPCAVKIPPPSFSASLLVSAFVFLLLLVVCVDIMTVTRSLTLMAL